ncbi:MAG TPA: hypothetical protein VIP57_11020 [Candidatus Dormibacteraeota bacterium]|jgi:hypothetical protein
MLRAAGIVALIVFTACTQTNPPVVASPSPVIPQGNWTQDLTLTGAITGQITGIVPDSGDQVSACTGSKTRTGEQWADTFYGSTDGGATVWEIAFVVKNFRGAGSYTTSDSSLVVRSLDKTKVWLNIARDKVTFTVAPTQQSGTINAALTDANSGKPAMKIAGTWNCRG